MSKSKSNNNKQGDMREDKCHNRMILQNFTCCIVVRCTASLHSTQPNNSACIFVECIHVAVVVCAARSRGLADVSRA